MIVIKKISGDGDWSDYEVSHDAEVVTVFRHKHGDGMATCLEKAAFAVEEEQLYYGRRVLLEKTL